MASAEGPGDGPASRRADSWDPDRYQRFAAERRAPFDDLLAQCARVPGGTVVDLGCGPGRLTADLHRRLGAARTTGVDSSAAMLAQAPDDVPGLTFTEGDLRDWAASDGRAADVVFANASLHWVPGHLELLGQLRSHLRPGGQLAFQVPANDAHPAHRLVAVVAAEPPFRALMAEAGGPPPDRSGHVLSPTAYAEVLHELGATEQRVRLEVYGHVLEETAAVVEWVEGTLLVPYRERLGPDGFDAFVHRYRERLLDEVGRRRPYYFTFRRILCWATFP